MRQLRPRDDSGMTLVELLVAMGIFSVVLAVFGAGVVSMTRSTARVSATSNVTNEARRAFSLLDKQVRYATAINSPTVVGNKGYVEFLTDATGTTSAGSEKPSLCTQWRLDGDADVLQYRTWDVGGTAKPWTTVARYVVTDPASATAFSTGWTGVDVRTQRLDVKLSLARGKAPAVVLDSSFVARNSSPASATNDNNNDGLSDQFVCTEMGRP